ncbi:YbjN domain-containing protein [Corynebacterium sp. 335C]
MAPTEAHLAEHPRLAPFGRLLDDWGIAWRDTGTSTGDAAIEFSVGDFTILLSWASVRSTFTVDARWRGLVPADDYATALDFVTGFNARHVAPRAVVDADGGLTRAQELGGLIHLSAQTYLLAGSGISDGQAEQFLKRSLVVVGDRFRPACLETWPGVDVAAAPFEADPRAAADLAANAGDADAADDADLADLAGEADADDTPTAVFSSLPEDSGVSMELQPQPVVLSDVVRYLTDLGMPDVPVVDDAAWIESRGTDVDIYLPGEGTADAGFLVFMAHAPLPREWEADLTHVGHLCNERNVRTALTTTTVTNLAGAGHEGWTLVSTAAVDVAEGLTNAQLTEAMRACPQTVGRSVRWTLEALAADS